MIGKSIILAMAAVVLSPALAANIQYITKEDVPSRFARTVLGMGHGYVSIEGKITKGDAASLQRAIDAYPQRSRQLNEDIVLVHVDSAGGDLTEAMRMGRILRQNFAWTFNGVGNHGTTCASACVFLYAGGVKRSMSSESSFGLHRPAYSDVEGFAALSPAEGKRRYDAMLTACKKYFEEMGIDSRLYDDIASVSSGQLAIKGRSYAESVKLIGNDPGFAEWRKAKLQSEKGIDIDNPPPRPSARFQGGKQSGADFGSPPRSSSDSGDESFKTQAQRALTKLHPDWKEVVTSTEFDAWKGTLPEMERNRLDSSWDPYFIAEKITEFKTRQGNRKPMSGWQEFARTNNYIAYIDRAKIRTDGQYKRYWEKKEFFEPRTSSASGKTYSESQAQYVADCRRMTSALATLVRYSPSGSVVDQASWQDHQLKFESSAPDGVGAASLEYVCQDR